MSQMLTVEGWALHMYNMADTNGYSEAYFFVFVIIGAYFLVNIYVAAISSVFLRVRHEHQILLKKYRRDRAYTFANAIEMANLLKDVILEDDAKLTWRQRLRRRTTQGMSNLKATMTRHGSRLKRTMTRAIDWNDPNSYLKRISSFGLMGIDQLDMEESAASSEPRRLGQSLSRNLSMGSRRAAHLGRSVSRSISMNTVFAAQTLSQKAYLIVNSKLFLYSVLFLISVNMAGLCTWRAKMSHTHLTRIHIMESILITIFAVEMILRFVAAGLTGFVDERIKLNYRSLFNVLF